MLKLIRFTLLLFYLPLSLLLVIPILLPRARHPNNILWVRFFARSMISLLGVRIEVEHKERLKQYRPSVLVINHQSALDVLLIATFIPPGAATVAKKTTLWNPLFGPIFWLTGNFFIKRNKTQAAYQTLDKIIKHVKEKKLMFTIMPEGTRNKDNNLKPFKRGAFYVASKGDFPLISLCLGTYEKTFDFNKWNAGTLFVNVLPPIDPKSWTDLDEERKKCRERMEKEIHRLDSKTMAFQEGSSSSASNAFDSMRS